MKRGRTLMRSPLPLYPSQIATRSALLDTEGLVAVAAFLADRRGVDLQRFEIRGLGLGLGDDLGEAVDLGLEAGFVFPDLRRDLVIAGGIHSLDAVRKHLWQFLGGLFELRQSSRHDRLIVGLFA